MLTRRVLGDGPGEEGIDAGGDFPVDYWCDVPGEVMRREASTIRPTAPTALPAACDISSSFTTGGDAERFVATAECSDDRRERGPSLVSFIDREPREPIVPYFLLRGIRESRGSNIRMRN